MDVLSFFSEKSCGCGRSPIDHPKDASIVVETNVKWSPDICTRRVPTDSYGEIEFIEDSSSRKPVSFFLILRN